ncbi:helix-turn-helix domain-containing protein [Microlunatus parietis]|uniref:HTH iclR-type domain-containing protein n=1 Tax=Microlunatus parietis TaxID=682979 RepID=A0A7Y9IAB2_9ACTN|nr:helix-turn-helix domain-containing protein [Microlunatus parietis]NYE73122.1 hypothetical protein [Microlunatus parietis]
MGNTPSRETLIDEALDRLAAQLPASWRLDYRPGAGDSRADGLVELVGPGSERLSFLVEAKRSGSISASLLIRALRDLQRTTGGVPVLFVSDYIGPALRDALAAEELSFADSTGWIRVVSAEPLVLLTGQGAARSPRVPAGSAVTRFNGLAASRIIRSLATTELPVRVRRLAGIAGVSPGSVSKLLATLASEGIVDRSDDGGVVAVRRRRLLRRWVADYAFAKTNHPVRYLIAARGLDRALTRVGELAGVALTGSAAARRLLPESATSVVPLRLLALYTLEPAQVAADLGLIDAEPATANVIIARPQDPDILTPVGDPGVLVTAPLPLVFADLLTLPGRSDAEAEQLMDALAASDPLWKA